MEKNNNIIKCPNPDCKSTVFILISFEKTPRVVNNKGEYISNVDHMYKCAECSSTFKSSIGPGSPQKLLQG